jgi:hypothetical protein
MDILEKNGIGPETSPLDHSKPEDPTRKVRIKRGKENFLFGCPNGFIEIEFEFFLQMMLIFDGTTNVDRTMIPRQQREKE